MVTAKENPPSARVHVPFLASLFAAVRWKPTRKRNTPSTPVRSRWLAEGYTVQNRGNWRKWLEQNLRLVRAQGGKEIPPLTAWVTLSNAATQPRESWAFGLKGACPRTRAPPYTPRDIYVFVQPWISVRILFLPFSHNFCFVAKKLPQVIGSPVQASDSVFSSQQSLSHTRHTW